MGQRPVRWYNPATWFGPKRQDSEQDLSGAMAQVQQPANKPSSGSYRASGDRQSADGRPSSDGTGHVIRMQQPGEQVGSAVEGLCSCFV